MELFGKVKTQSSSPLKLAGNEELLLNLTSSRITLSTALLTSLGWADKAIGFGYDADATLGAKAYIYNIENVEEGCKVGKNGTVTNKFHTAKLAEAFASDLTADVTRLKLDVDVENTITHESGTVLYKVSFLETLADLKRVKAAATIEELVVNSTDETSEDVVNTPYVG